MSSSDDLLIDRLRGIIDRLGWYATVPCSSSGCGQLLRYSVLDSSTVSDEGVQCGNGHGFGGDLRISDARVGYRSLFQDAIELAAMVIMARTHFGSELALVMAHTAFEVFLKGAVEDQLKQRNLDPETAASVLDDLKPNVGGYLGFLKSAGVISGKDKGFWDSLRKVSTWRDQFVHGGKGPAEEEVVEACEKIAEVFVRLGDAHLASAGQEKPEAS